MFRQHDKPFLLHEIWQDFTGTNFPSFIFFVLRWPLWELVPVVLGGGVALSNTEKWESGATEQV